MLKNIDNVKHDSVMKNESSKMGYADILYPYDTQLY